METTQTEEVNQKEVTAAILREFLGPLDDETIENIVIPSVHQPDPEESQS